MKKALLLFLIVSIGLYSVFTLSSDEATHIACIGDSNTIGHGLFPALWFSYPSKLQVFLGLNFRVHNYGVAGSTVYHSDTYSYTKSDSFKESSEVKHDYFIFMLGTNDSKNYRNDFSLHYKDLLKRYDFPETSKVILCTPPVAFSDHWGIRNDLLRTKIRGAILKIAKEGGYRIFDAHLKMSDKTYYQDDGVHLNAKGTQKLAELLKDEFFVSH